MPIGSGPNSTPPLSRVDGTPGTRQKSSKGNIVSADGNARRMNGKKVAADTGMNPVMQI